VFGSLSDKAWNNLLFKEKDNQMTEFKLCEEMGLEVSKRGDKEADLILLDPPPEFYCQAIVPIKFLKLIKEFGQ
jgi:hypothetical protein